MGRFQRPETAGSPPSPQPAWCSVRVQLVFQTDLLEIDLACQAIELSSKNPNPTRGENAARGDGRHQNFDLSEHQMRFSSLLPGDKVVFLQNLQNCNGTRRSHVDLCVSHV